LEFDPQAPIHFRLCSLLLSLGRAADAVAALQRAADACPNHATILAALGVALQVSGRLPDAIENYRRALQLHEADPQTHCNLSLALCALAKSAEAATHARRAVELNPRDAEAHNCLGIALCGSKQQAEAAKAFQTAIALRPEFHYYTGLAAALRDCDRLDEALAAVRRAIELNPRHAEAYMNLGGILLDLGRADEAVGAYRQAVQLNPQSPATASALLFAMHFMDDKPKRLAEAHRQWATVHARGAPRSVATRDMRADRRLRLGYVSPDFRLHSVSFFLDGLLANHDHQRFEIFCYSDVAAPDEVTQRLRLQADHFRDVAGHSNEQLRALIEADGIDVLVDLAGHTAGNRLPVFAMRAAPLQISYLGYPNTTGLKAMDYRITDSHADPPGMTESLHSERLLRLNPCAWCYAAPDAAQVNPPPARSSGAVTFGSFNALSKLSDVTVSLWSRILHEVPDARLFLKARGLANAGARRLTLERFARHGISADRVQLLPFDSSLAAHFLRYHEIDIALDTFPYHGTTTTCEALWMGVPVLTLAGSTHVSRVGVSLLHNAGIPELIASSADEYLALARRLAGDSALRAGIRANLRQRVSNSVLCDAAGFARRFEAAMLDAVQRRAKPDQL
jgi:predicted O-linked N-acetylglucosamine transferase (SPINDLY family)